MNKCYIFAGGDFDGFFDQIDDNDMVIAADRGYEHAKASDVEVDYIFGDFDSTTMPDLSNVIKLNPIKDYTDTMAALMFAKDKGYKEIVIYGAFGGRDSHTIANIRASLFLKKQGLDVYLKSKHKLAFIIDSTFDYEFKDEDDFYVSIFSLSEIASGLSIKGLYYELNGYEMSIDDSLGVSNETCGKDFTISIEEGYILVIFESKGI